MPGHRATGPRRGNPDCAILILHHTLTGKAGARKATGYGRASFGRGSKALHFWTRGQINVVPADPEDPSRLVVACGKNSNGPEFAPFGIRLDPATMIYELDPEFDLEAWESSLHGEAATSVVKPTPEFIAALVKDVPLSRKELTVLIMDEFGVGKSRGYHLITLAEGQTIRRNGLKQYEVMPH